MTKNITFDLADTVEMNKPHACQTNNWEVLRLGADIRLKCMGCGHQIMVPRKLVEKNTKDLKKKA